MTMTVAALWRYPVKSLAGEAITARVGSARSCCPCRVGLNAYRLAMTRASIAIVLLPCLVVSQAAGARAPVLRLNGIGPLSLGMSRPTAIATGWLANRSLGCELASPRPVVYSLTGPRAPRGIAGSVSFVGEKLVSVSIRRGAQTGLGIAPGRSTVRAMVATYRSHGFRVTNRYEATFQARFVTASRAGQTIGAVASKSTIDSLGIPHIDVCE